MRMGKRIAKIRSEYRKFKARYVHKGRMLSYPDILVIEPTSKCTQKCTCCPHGVAPSSMRPRYTMTKEDFDRIINNLDIPIKSVYLHLHGEPLINPALPYIAESLIKRGVEEINLFSNANFTDYNIFEDLLKLTYTANWNIAFSIEIHDGQKYESIRYPSHYGKIIENLTRIDKIMDSYNVGYSINAILDGEDINKAFSEVRDIFRHFDRLEKINFSSRFPWPYLPETGDIAGRLSVNRPICSQVNELPVIMADGSVGLCNCDYRGETIVGNVKDSKYTELVNSKKACKFRVNLLKRNPDANGICGECLIPRYKSFQRSINRKFALTATEENLKKYFDSYKIYFFNE